MPVIGIIGGSGLYQIDGLRDVEWRRVESPFGSPSDELCFGTLDGTRVVFLPRHGRGHRISPSEINFRANIDATSSAGGPLAPSPAWPSAVPPPVAKANSSGLRHDEGGGRNATSLARHLQAISKCGRRAKLDGIPGGGESTARAAGHLGWRSKQGARSAITSLSRGRILLPLMRIECAHSMRGRTPPPASPVSCRGAAGHANRSGRRSRPST